MDLLLAVAQNDIIKTRHLLQAGFDANAPILWPAKNTCSPVIPTDIGSSPELLAKVQSDQEYHTHALNIAVLGGHAEMVQLLLNAGADVNMKDGRGRSALICAIYGLDIDSSYINTSNLHLISQTHDAHFLIIKKMLLRHPNLNPTTLNSPQYEIKGITPLCLASYLGKIKIIELLLDDGRVDVDGRDSKNATALMYAARDGNFPVVQMLLRFDASPDITDSHGWSALQYAENNTDIIQICEETLRRKRPDVSMIYIPINTINRYPTSYIDLSTLISSLPNYRPSHSHLEVKTLQELDLMDPVTAPAVQLVQLAFLHSIKSHDYESLRALLSLSSPIKRNRNRSPGALLVNHRNPKTGLAAIHHAMRAKPLPSLDTIAMLYQAGADINARTCYGRTALHHLARIGMDSDGKSWGIQKRSIKLGPATQSVTEAQQPLLSYVTSPSSPPPALSVHHKEDNQTNIATSVASPASLSCFAHRLSTFSGVSSHSTESDNTPESSTTEVFQHTLASSILAAPTVSAHLGLCTSVLIQLGALVNIADLTGYTPLHFAAEFGAVPEVLETLILDGNADLHVKNKKQQTPLDICKSEKIRLFMLALEKQRKSSQETKSTTVYSTTNTNINDHRYFHSTSGSPQPMTWPLSKSTTRSTTTYNKKVRTHHLHYNNNNLPTSVILPTTATKHAVVGNRTKKLENEDAHNQIDLYFGAMVNMFLNYHETFTDPIDKTLSYLTKTILQLRHNNNNNTAISPKSTAALISAGSQKAHLKRTIAQLRSELGEAYGMIDQAEQCAEQVARHFQDELAQVERIRQADCELLELQQDKVEKLYGTLERMDSRFFQLEQDQNELISQMEYWRPLALRQLRWFQQNGDRVKYNEAADLICLDNLMQALTTLSTILMINHNPALYLNETLVRITRDLDQNIERTLQQTASSLRLANARTTLESKWQQVTSQLATPSSAPREKGNDKKPTAMAAIIPISRSVAHWAQQLLTASPHLVSPKSAPKYDPRSLNELELSFDILSTNLHEIQKDIDALNIQSSHIMESKKHMHDTCLSLEKELEALNNRQPHQQHQKRINFTGKTNTIAPSDRTPAVVRRDLVQVTQDTQILCDRQRLLDEEATTLKREYENIEYQLEAIKEALHQVRPPLLLRGLLERFDTDDGPTLYVEKGWQENQQLVAAYGQDTFEPYLMDLAEDSDSASLSSSSSIFSSESNDKVNNKSSNNKNSKNNKSNIRCGNAAGATLLKNTFTTPLAIQCLLSRLDASLYSLKTLGVCHLRQSRQLLSEVKVSLAQVIEDIDDARNQMIILYGTTAEITRQVFDFKAEAETVVRHRKEEVVKVWEAVDEISMAIDIKSGAQKYQQEALLGTSSTIPQQKCDASVTSAAIFLENQHKQQQQQLRQQQQQYGSTVLIRRDNDKDRQQQLILYGLEQLQVFNKHLQHDLETLKSNQLGISQRIRHINTSFIELQLDQLVGQGDTSLISMSGHSTELIDGIRLHHSGANLNKDTVGATTISQQISLTLNMCTSSNRKRTSAMPASG